MKHILSVLVTLMMISSSALAATKANCTGESKDKQKVDVQIESGAMKVSVGAKQIALNQVRDDLESATAAQDAGTKNAAMINWTKHEEALEDGSFEGVLSLAVDGKDTLSDVEISCKK